MIPNKISLQMYTYQLLLTASKIWHSLSY